MSTINYIRFRAMLDQADATLSSRLSVAPAEMLVSTFLEVFKPIKFNADSDGAFALIEQCGPALKSMAVFALLTAIADELCRRVENEAIA